MNTLAVSIQSSLNTKGVTHSNQYNRMTKQTLNSLPKIMEDPPGLKQEPEDTKDFMAFEEPIESLTTTVIHPSEEEQQMHGDITLYEKPIILCGICDKSFLEFPAFIKHCKEEHGDAKTPLKCAMCGPSSKLLKSPYTLKKHQRYLHSMSKMKCPHCPKVLCPNYHKRHIKTAHIGVPKFDCSLCGKSLATRKGYNDHMDNYHFPERANYVNCHICSKRLRESYLPKHLRYHKLDDSFMCEICGIVMHNRGNFMYHQETHRPTKRNHLCEICGKSYKTIRCLKKHSAIHTGQNKVKCKTCGAILANSSLKAHLMIHTNDRPFICKFCGKTFKHPGHRVTHERIHTGERPYQCKICPSAFYEAGNLTKHMKKVHSNGKTSNKKFKLDTDADNETVDDPDYIDSKYKDT